MVDIIDDDFMVCTDCVMAIVHDDYSGLNYYCDSEESVQRRTADIQAGMRAAGGSIVPGERDWDEEFSTRDCDCCGESLAGSRHHCVVLSND